MTLLLAACAGGPGSAAPAPMAAIDVGTFNIRYANSGDGDNAWRHRTGLVLDVLREGDVWGLQEALPRQVEQIRAALPEFSMLVRSRDADPGKGEACPLLFRSVRWSLDPDEHGTFWLSETPEVAGSRSWDAALPRIVTFARLVERGSGRAFYVYNAHLDHRGARARLESARLLAKRIAARRQPDPVVVLGDFNADPASPPLQALLDSGEVALVDAWRKTHPDAPERGTFNGWRAELGDRRIDHVLVTAGVEVSVCTIDDRRPGGRWPSDHVPVRALVALPEPATER